PGFTPVVPAGSMTRTARAMRLKRSKAAPARSVSWISPAEPHAEVQGVVVHARAGVAVVAQVELRGLGDLGVGLQAHHRTVGLRRGGVDGEGRERCATQSGRDRALGRGELVLPADLEPGVDGARVADRDVARDADAER